MVSKDDISELQEQVDHLESKGTDNDYISGLKKDIEANTARVITNV